MFFPFFIASCICVCILYPSETDAHVKLPKGFIQCRQNDPEFSRCILKAAKLAVPELARGQPKFGIPRVDPLRINTLYIDQGHGSVNIKLNFTDLDIIGLKTTAFEDFSVDFKKEEAMLSFKTAVPLVLNGTYTINGKVLVLPIRGSGHSRLVLNDFRATATVNLKSIRKRDEIYWKIDKLDFNFSTSKLNIMLENLFNGDKALGDNMNTFLNENWEILLDELRPAFRSALSTVFSQCVQQFLDRVPLAQIFPPQ